jgi:hypothetical protein
MGSASSVASTQATLPLPATCSQGDAEEPVMCAQTLASDGSADPILVVYIYADARDTVAHSTAEEFSQRHMPALRDMAASRGLRLIAQQVRTEEQLLDSNDAISIFSERCSCALLAFVSDTNETQTGLPAQLPLAFVQRCIAAIKKHRPDAAQFLSEVLTVSQRPSSLTSCFSGGWCARARLSKCRTQSRVLPGPDEPDAFVSIPTYSWFNERLQLCLREILFDASARMAASLEDIKVWLNPPPPPPSFSCMERLGSSPPSLSCSPAQHPSWPPGWRSPKAHLKTLALVIKAPLSSSSRTMTRAGRCPRCPSCRFNTPNRCCPPPFRTFRLG